MTSLVGKTVADAELLNFARKSLFERSRLFTPDATLAVLQDLKLWVGEELSFEEAASASFGRLLTELERSEYLDQLPPLFDRFERLVSAYFVRRGSVVAFHGFCNIWRERLLRRVLLFAEEELEVSDHGHPQLQYALLVSGSLGRHEQTLEENDPYFLIRGGGDAEYFETFGYRVLAILDQFGLLGKAGSISAARQLWRGSLEEWKALAAGEGEDHSFSGRIHLLAEMRCICGDDSTGREGLKIAAFHLENCLADPRFVQFAKDAVVAEQVALGVFGGIRVERTGERVGCLHLLESGLSPLTSVVRLLALQHELHPGPTLSKLAALGSMGVVEKSLAERLESAYHLLAGLRISKQIALEQPYVNPSDLNALDQQRLKAALEAVRQLQREVRRTQLDTRRPLAATLSFL